MKIMLKILALAAGLVGAAAPALAQEVLVTGQRRGGEAGYYGGIVATSRPVVALKRTADYGVQSVHVVGDERDKDKRRSDLKATIRAIIGAAAKQGFELATGDYVLQPLTLANYETLYFSGDGRPDTDRAQFLIKLKLAPGMAEKTADERIKAFYESVTKTGRTVIRPDGRLTLSVTNPDQYRGQIIALIAEDSAMAAGKFGGESGVDVSGLDRPVEWARAEETNVFLFLPASYVIRKR
jgi:hypothetical protein